MKPGLSDKSELKEEIIKSKDGKTATRYRIVEETIDLEALRREKEALEAQLNEKEPDEKELLKWAKQHHQYYEGREFIEERIMKIDELLK